MKSSGHIRSRSSSNSSILLPFLPNPSTQKIHDGLQVTSSYPSRVSHRVLSTSVIAVVLLFITLSFSFLRPTSSPSPPILMRGWNTYNGAGWGSAITQNHISWQLCQRFGWKISLPDHKLVQHCQTTIRSELFTSQEYGFSAPVCMLSDVLEATHNGGFGVDFIFVKSFLEGGTASEEEVKAVMERSMKCGSIVDDMGFYHDVALLAGASSWIREITAPWSSCEERDDLVVHVRWGDLETLKEENDKSNDRGRIMSEEALKTVFEGVRGSIQITNEGQLIPKILMENHNSTFLDNVFGIYNYEVVNTPSIQTDVARLSCARNSIMAQSDFSLMAAHMAEGTVVWYPVEREDRYHWQNVRNVTMRGYVHLTGDLLDSELLDVEGR